MVQREAKIVKPGGARVDPVASVIPSGQAMPGARPRKRPPAKRGVLHYLMLWVGLVAIMAAIMVAIVMLPKAKDWLAATQAPSGEPEAEGAGTAAGSGEPAGSDDGGPADVQDEVERVEIPKEVQLEEPDEEDVLESQPAGLPEGVVVVAPSPEPDVGTPVFEQVSGSREWVVHKMAPQETVDQVAHRYGVRPESIRMWNGIAADKQKLRSGARLKVKAEQIPPQRRRVEYIVQPGDSWLSIGIQFGIDTRELRSQNWEATKQFYAGQTLTLWIDPLVYYWIKYDKRNPSSAEPSANIRRGAVGVGPAQNGRLINGVRIPDGEGYSLRMLPSSYGTTHAVITVAEAFRDFESKWPYEPEIVIGSMSAKHGGPLEGHKSHQTGRDVDIRLPLEASSPNWFPVEPDRVDFVALWFLITAFADTGEVSIIFLDYEMQKLLFKAAAKLGAPEEERRRIVQWPRGAAAHRGLVRHAPGHEQHIHVRIRCGPHETECVDVGSASISD